MSKILKNTTGSPVNISDCGVTVAASGQHTIDPGEYPLFARSSSVVTLVGAGTLLVNDGSADLSISDGIDLIKGGMSGLRDANNALMTRPKFAETGWTFQGRFIEFATATDASIYDKKDDGSDYSNTTLKFYKADGSEIIDAGGYGSKQLHIDAECVETRFQWNPAYDHEIVGGDLFCVIPNTDVRLWVIGAPGLAAYGGHKIMISGCNLRRLAVGHLSIDGRTSKRMNYNAGLPAANAMRFTLKHNVGVKVTIMVSLEHYKA